MPARARAGSGSPWSTSEEAREGSWQVFLLAGLLDELDQPFVFDVREPGVRHLEERGHGLLRRPVEEGPHHVLQGESPRAVARDHGYIDVRSEEHTSELQSQSNLVCRLLL